MNTATIPQSGATGAVDLTAVKARQQATWASGDYAVIGCTLQIVGETLAEALAGAAGNGNVTLAAARRWCEVVSTDYVPALLARGRERAAAERLAVEFREADAEALPFPDASFDVVVSTFGAMFAPDPRRVAAEMLRVCRPGGRIGMANWTPAGFVGQIFKAIGKHVAPPARVESPALWGTRARLDELFGAQASSIDAPARDFLFRYRSPAHWIEVFRNWYGPVHKAYGTLDLAGQAALTEDLTALIARFNRANDGTMVVPGEYLEVVVRRR
ncbi:MAG TPA: class I SAM-dependent methyltransferase [Ideonella sp.]|nr:class I SAM-dependent methyltransferase [Ideonella sp.]